MRKELQLFAHPYDQAACGFYFTSLENYELETANHVNKHGEPVEEYEIQFINGTDEACTFARLANPNQGDLASWFDGLEQFEGLNDMQQVVLAYLMEDLHRSISDALDIVDDVIIIEGTATDWATDYVNECCELPQFALDYFDYEAFGRDADLNGDISTFRHEGSDYVISNPNDL